MEPKLRICKKCGTAFYSEEAYKAHRVPSKWFSIVWIAVYDLSGRYLPRKPWHPKYRALQPSYCAGWPNYAFTHHPKKVPVMCITDRELDYGPTGGAL